MCAWTWVCLALLLQPHPTHPKPLEPCPTSCRCFYSEGLRRADCKLVPEWADRVYDAQDVRVIPPPAGRGSHSSVLHLTHFDMFPKALQLSITNRSIVELIPGGFHGLRNLNQLDLSNNLLSCFNKKVFRRMPALRHLALQGNPINMELHKPLLTSSSLRSLDLSHCNIVEIPKGSLDGVRNLISLSLRGNPINLETSRPLVPISSLMELDLSACKLEYVPPVSLGNLVNLRRLYLDGNKLKTIEKDILPKGLQFFDVSSNQIREVPTAVISSLKNLSRLEIHDNPVACTCSLIGLQGWMARRPIIVEKPVICSEPDSYKGLSWTKVDEMNLCRTEAAQDYSSSNSDTSADSDVSTLEGEGSSSSSSTELQSHPCKSDEMYAAEENFIKHRQPPIELDSLLEKNALHLQSNNEENSIQSDQPYQSGLHADTPLGDDPQNGHILEGGPAEEDQRRVLPTARQEQAEETGDSGDWEQTEDAETTTVREEVEYLTESGNSDSAIEAPDLVRSDDSNDGESEPDAEIFMNNHDTVAMGRSMPDGYDGGGGENHELGTSGATNRPGTLTEKSDILADNLDPENPFESEEISYEDYGLEQDRTSSPAKEEESSQISSSSAEGGYDNTSSLSTSEIILDHTQVVSFETTVLPIASVTSSSWASFNDPSITQFTPTDSATSNAGELLSTKPATGFPELTPTESSLLSGDQLEGNEFDPLEQVTVGSTSPNEEVTSMRPTTTVPGTLPSVIGRDHWEGGQELGFGSPNEVSRSTFPSAAASTTRIDENQGEELFVTPSSAITVNPTYPLPEFSTYPVLQETLAEILIATDKSVESSLTRKGENTQTELISRIPDDAVYGSHVAKAAVGKEALEQESTGVVDSANEFSHTGHAPTEATEVVSKVTTTTDQELGSGTQEDAHRITNVPPPNHGDITDNNKEETNLTGIEQLTIDKVAVGESVGIQKSTITYIVLGCIVMAFLVLVVWALLRGKADVKEPKPTIRNLPEDHGTEMKDMINPLLEPPADQPGTHEFTAEPRRVSVVSLQLIPEVEEDTLTDGKSTIEESRISDLPPDTPTTSASKIEMQCRTATPETVSRRKNAMDRNFVDETQSQPARIVPKQSTEKLIDNSTSPTPPRHSGIETVASKVKVVAGVINANVPMKAVLINCVNGVREPTTMNGAYNAS